MRIHTGEETADVMRVCQQNEPDLREVIPGHWAACHFAENYATAKPTVPQLEHHREVVPERVEVSGVASGEKVIDPV